MENFDITRFFKTLANSKLYIFITIVLFIFVGYFYSFYYVTPMYESSATVVLTQNDKVDITQEAITGSDITLNQNLLSTYTKLTKSDRVLEQVIKNLKLNMSLQDLSNLITVQSMNNTEVFKITVKSNNNELAANIANEVVEVFSKEVEILYNMNNVYIMDLAEVTNVAYNINHIKDIIMFAVAGLFTSLVMVVIIYLLDTTIKCEEDIEGYAKLSVLSTIPTYQNSENRNVSELIVNEQPKDPISECFKTFRTNIMFSTKNKELKTILVTSSSMGEGKSFVSSNLAVTFAQSGKRVILIDTDMRKGRIHKIFNIANKHGLSNCLSDIGENGELVNINWYIQKSKIPNLHVMTSGIVPPNPSELLSSPNMKKFLEALKTQYDIIICDGTPCMLVSDSIALSKIVDSTIIVTANKTTKIDSLIKVKKSIEIVGGNISGAIINKMEISSKEYKNSYYYGEHDAKRGELETKIVEDSEILNSNLSISTNIIEENEEEINENEEHLYDNSRETKKDDNLNELTNMISDNTKEVVELKNIYKNIMQTSFDAMFRKDKTKDILEEVENIKKLYEENTNLQNENFDDKFTEQSDNMLYALNNIKYTYENAINEQSENITKLEEKITSSVDNKFDEQQNSILGELENIKQTYQNTIKEQSENITALEEKITNNVDNKFSIQAKSIINGLINIKGIYENTMKTQKESIIELEKKITNNVDNKFSEQQNSILDELESIKETYENAINEQSENIRILEEKITDNVENKFDEQSSNILNELDDVKRRYEEAINEQSENIRTLEEKITDNVENKFDEQSSNILNELNDVKQRYEEAIKEQKESITALEEKISNINFNEESNNILNELNKVKTSYEEAISIQNRQIETLDNKISSVNNYEVLAAINGLYRQLYDMGERFTYLEKKAIDNEKLIKSVNIGEYGYYRQDKYIDSKKADEKIKGKLDEKVVRIQDYLESSYNANNIASNATILNEANFASTKINNKPIIERTSSNNPLSKNVIDRVKNTSMDVSNTQDIANVLEKKVTKENNNKTVNDVTKYTSKTSSVVGTNLGKNSVYTSKNTEKISTILEDKLENTNKNVQKETINTTVENRNIKANNNEEIKKKNTSILKSINDVNKTQKTNVTKKVEFIDYSKIKNTQKRGFFNFNKQLEEEPVTIVSQILCGNKESVG